MATKLKLAALAITREILKDQLYDWIMRITAAGGSTPAILGIGPFDTINIAAPPGGERMIDVAAGDLSPLDNGAQVWCESVKANFEWRTDFPAATVTDNITTCRPTAWIATGLPGAFVRVPVADPNATLQTVWCFDGTSGNDENSGLDAANALKTPDEFVRRWGKQQYQASTAYHFRLLTDNLSFVLPGVKNTNTAIYVHGSMTDRQGAWTGSPAAPLYSGVANVLDAQNTATNARWAITSNGLAVNWAGLIDKRIRFTNGAAVNAVGWAVLQDPGTPKKAAIGDIMTPVASFSVAPISVPAFADAAPAAGDSFVVESLRVVTRFHIELEDPPTSFITTTCIVFDSISTVVSGAEYCAWYADGCTISTLRSHMSFYTTHNCQHISLSDDGAKTLSGYNTTSLVLENNTAGSNAVVTFWTIEGVRALVFSGTGCQLSPDTWRPGKIGIYNNTGVAFVCWGHTGVRMGSTTAIYGLGNTAPFFGLGPNSVIIAQNGNWLGITAVTTSTPIILMNSGGFATATTSIPAFDVETSLYSFPRVLSKANMEATTQAGGFFYNVIDSMTGAGCVRY